MKWPWPWHRDAETVSTGDAELQALTERVEHLEEDVDRQKRDIRRIAAAVGIQSLDWWRRRDTG